MSISNTVKDQTYMQAYLNYLATNKANNTPSFTSNNLDLVSLLALQKAQAQIQKTPLNVASDQAERTEETTSSEILESFEQLISLIAQLFGKNEEEEIRSKEEERIKRLEIEADELASGAESEAAGAMFSTSLVTSFPPGSQTSVEMAQASFTAVSTIQSHVSKLQAMPQEGLIPGALGRAENALSFAIGAAVEAARYAGINFRNTGFQINLIA